MKTLAPTVQHIEKELAEIANAPYAASARGYFKTGPGQYGEGDRFLGIRVPVLRALSRRHEALDVRGCNALLHSPFHEARLLALLILVRKYDKGDEQTRDAIYQLYLASTGRINNWDLVDTSAPQIVGRHLERRDRTVLAALARSESVWERRIAILATLHFIRAGEFDETFRIADLLLADTHDLIHKAVGWMLREVGIRNRADEEAFLQSRYRQMPRTMLRYAIEKFPEPLRLRYLHGVV